MGCPITFPITMVITIVRFCNFKKVHFKSVSCLDPVSFLLAMSKLGRTRARTLNRLSLFKVLK